MLIKRERGGLLHLPHCNHCSIFTHIACLQGGAPARFLRRNFVEETIKFYSEDKLVDVIASDAEVSPCQCFFFIYVVAQMVAIHQRMSVIDNYA